MTSLRRIDVSTSCACWDFGPPTLPPSQFSKPSYAYDLYRVLIFSSAVFEENFEVLSWPWRRRRRLAKTLTFSNISVITEDIYLKLRIVVNYEKGNPYQ